jgi:hypothetical protein
MKKSKTGISLPSIKAPGVRRLSGAGSVGGRALGPIRPASMPGLTGHTAPTPKAPPVAATKAYRNDFSEARR